MKDFLDSSYGDPQSYLGLTNYQQETTRSIKNRQEALKYRQEALRIDIYNKPIEKDKIRNKIHLYRITYDI